MSRRPHPLASLPTPLVCALLALAIGAAWSNSLQAPFLMDDFPAIVDNPTIRDVTSLRTLAPPSTAGETVSGRPALNFSFALNAALGGLSPASFRTGNLLIHFTAALVLFGIIWRTLRDDDPRAVGPDLRAGRSARMTGGTDSHAEPARPEVGPYPPARTGALECERMAPPSSNCHRWFALVISLAWALHPLQTESVTYIVQRAESLSALFILLTVYGFIRYADTTGAARIRWAAACIGSALLGAATKETAAVAPLLVLLYDRAFVSRSFASAWRTHRPIYAGLAVSWVVLALLVASNAGRGGSAGFGSDVGVWTYALTQAYAVVHYVRLVVWPHPLVFDYGVVAAGGIGDVWLQGIVLLIALGATLLAVVRNHPLGFPAAAAFLLLAPTSSVIPIATQTIAEHRMYLALAPLLLMAGLAIHRLAQRMHARALPAALAGLVVLALASATFARNRVYRSDLSLWADVVAKRADNPRAHHNLGVAFLERNQLAEAASAFERALELQPGHALAHYQLGTIAVRRRTWDEAIRHLLSAVAAEPGDVAMRVDLGHALTQANRLPEAERQFRAALELDPDAHDARSNLAGVVLAQGHIDEAETLLRQVLADSPGLAAAHHQLGLVHDAAGRRSAAQEEFREALRLEPGLAAPRVALANLVAERGGLDEAGEHYRRAIELEPGNDTSHFGLGNVLAQRRRFREAMAAYREALRLNPSHRGARQNLGNCQLVTHDFAAAADTFREVLRLHPDDAVAKEHLQIAETLLRRSTEPAARPLNP